MFEWRIPIRIFNVAVAIGDGANGKSQLLNLMKAAMGELAEKVECIT